MKSTSYEDHAALAEEKKFLKNYTVPFVQLDPFKTILVFSHIHNTFDKRNLLKNPNTMFQKESPRTVEDFIKTPEESLIKDFFMKNIDELLMLTNGGTEHETRCIGANEKNGIRTC